MPFASKAQQRLFFAKDPQKAREWAKETPNMSDLPEKKHPQQNPDREPVRTKLASDGMFFQKRAQARKGHFFRDMAGRDDGSFHQKLAVDEADAPEATTPAPTTNMGDAPDSGEGTSGGMYGTGCGPKKPGKPAAKTAAATPNDWDADAGLPTGFHRAAQEQPEALESGGARFHSTEAQAPNYSSGGNQRHGVVEGGSVRTSALTPSQMGKHAAPRFLGTVYGDDDLAKHAATADEYLARAQSYAGDRGAEAKKSLGTFGRGLASKSDEVIKGITQSPTTTAIAALIAGKMGLGALKGAGRGAARMVGRRKPPAGAAGNILGGVRKLITGR